MARKISNVTSEFQVFIQDEDKEKEEGEKVTIRQPCCVPGVFITIGKVRISIAKEDEPSAEEIKAVGDKALQAATDAAGRVCRTNRDCPNVEFVKFEEVKAPFCLGKELTAEVKIMWHCVKKKEEEAPKGPPQKPPAPPKRRRLPEGPLGPAMPKRVVKPRVTMRPRVPKER